MTETERLRLAELLLCDDLCSDAEMLVAGLRQPQEGDALAFATRLGRLYTLVHPAGSCRCRHADWEGENEREYAAAVAAGELANDAPVIAKAKA